MDDVTTQTRSAPRSRKPALPSHSTDGSSKKPGHDHYAELKAAGNSTPDAIRLDFSQPEMQFGLTAKSVPLFDGISTCQLTVDGRPAALKGPWSSALTYEDEDGEYLELQLFVNDRLRIDRHFFLSRRDCFAIIADAVIATGAAQVEYRWNLPIANPSKAKGDVATREVQLGSARYFPLWLPQERVHSAAGNCTIAKQELALSYTVGGPGLYLPMVIDWNPKRRRAAAEWRTLTVTEPAKVVSPSGAAAHRLRLGKEQLFVFRGLAQSFDPRAVLGVHTWHETLFGWFLPNGNVKTLMATDVD